MTFHTLGLDLAGSLTSTGGVGSVLATSKTQTSGYYTRTYLYDGNGNVISLCKPDTGTITANYTYSPFGKLIKSGGIEIADFTFSTKYADETGLSYYGYRFYSAKLGRWLRKDRTEIDSINLYIFINNFVLNCIDILGKYKVEAKDFDDFDRLMAQRSAHGGMGVAILETLEVVIIGKIKCEELSTKNVSNKVCQSCLQYTVSCKGKYKIEYTYSIDMPKWEGAKNLKGVEKQAYERWYNDLYQHELGHIKIFDKWYKNKKKEFFSTAQGCSKKEACKLCTEKLNKKANEWKEELSKKETAENEKYDDEHWVDLPSDYLP